MQSVNCTLKIAARASPCAMPLSVAHVIVVFALCLRAPQAYDPTFDVWVSLGLAYTVFQVRLFVLLSRDIFFLLLFFPCHLYFNVFDVLLCRS